MLLLRILLSPLWLIFVLPGRALIAFQYYFPSKRYDAIKSARQRGKLGFEIFHSLLFWIFVGILVASFLAKPKDQASKEATTYCAEGCDRDAR